MFVQKQFAFKFLYLYYILRFVEKFSPREIALLNALCYIMLPSSNTKKKRQIITGNLSFILKDPVGIGFPQNEAKKKKKPDLYHQKNIKS